MAQYKPRLHNEIYPFVYPSKFRASLKNKVTVITGSVGTIGQAMAECFAVAGANLLLVYNRTEPPGTLKERCLDLGASGATFMKCNVAELSQCEDLVRQVEKNVGNVDILINNAAVGGIGPLHTQSPQQFLYSLAVNLHGPCFLTRLLLPSFMQRRTGCIINVASRGGTVDIPFSISYSVAKTALIRFTSCVQKELDAGGYGEDVHLYAIHPGGVPSSLTTQDIVDHGLADYPEIRKHASRMLNGMKDSAHLSGMVSVALASGIAKRVLRGRYFDIQQDLEDVVAQVEAIENNPDLYSLHMRFLGGLPNDGGTEHTVPEEKFEFPGL